MIALASLGPIPDCGQFQYTPLLQMQLKIPTGN